MFLNVSPLFLGGGADAFVKLGKATISFIMSVRPSIRMKQLGSNSTGFDEILYLNVQREIQFSLKSEKNNRHFACRPIYVQL